MTEEEKREGYVLALTLIWMRRERARIQDAFLPGVQRVFRQEFRRIRVWLRDRWLPGATPPPDFWLPTQGPLHDILTRIWREAIDTFGSEMARRIGYGVDPNRPPGPRGMYRPWNQTVEAFMSRQVALWVDSISRTSRKRVDNILIRPEVTRETAAGSLEALYRGFEENRAPDIVANSTVSASGDAQDRLAAQWRADTGLYPVKQWWTQRDERVRPAHVNLQGVTRLIGQEFLPNLAYPRDPRAPLSLTARCFLGHHVPRAVGRLELVYRRHFEGEIVRIDLPPEVSHGGLSVTPNHPILTNRGWVPAGELQEGDYLIHGAGLGFDSVDPNIQDPPASFEQIFQTLADTGQTKRVAGGIMDFHGDGREAEIEIVGPDLHLLDETESSRIQHGSQSFFPESDSIFSGRFGLGSGQLGGQDQSPSTLQIGLTHSEVHRFGSISRADTLSQQPFPDSEARTSEFFREGFFRHPSQVECLDLFGGQGSAQDPLSGVSAQLDSVVPEDRIQRGLRNTPLFAEALDSIAREIPSDYLVPVIRTQRTQFSGHVYNLQTSSGFYMVDNIPCKNCRCFLLYFFPREGMFTR